MCLGLVCLSALALTYALLPGFGITGVGLAWMISQTVVAVWVGVWWLRPLLWQRAVSQRPLDLGPALHYAKQKEGQHDN